MVVTSKSDKHGKKDYRCDEQQEAKEKVTSKKEITTEKGKKGTEFAQLIKKLGNPQRLVWGELLDGGEGFQATYQMPGEPEVVMELKKKGSKLVLK